MEEPSIEAKEQVEIDYWRTSLTENPDSDSIENLVNKFSEARVVLLTLERHRQIFESASTVLELGAGQGWTSCILKRMFPDKRMIASDISPFAIASHPKWEHILQAKLDQTFACRSYEIPLPDSSVDLVFCFQAAHHFVRHRRTLNEIHRILTPDGVCLYLFEPVCQKFIYRIAYARVNAKRPEVPEDVLVYKRLIAISRELNFASEMQFNPIVINRGPLQALYFSILQKFPMLQTLLPCTGDFVFRKGIKL
jgi:ubiquinone/menaquinone biosynthesis C-methylase UbiE